MDEPEPVRHNPTDLIVRAQLFSEAAHEGQFRKYTGGPYAEHPRRVAAQAARLGLSVEAIAAAFLHDVVEDCSVAPDEIYELFGQRVYDLVELLTDLQTPAEGNRAQRHRGFLQRLVRSGDDEAQTLKILDITDNARSIVGYDPKFWATAVRKEASDAVTHLDRADRRAVKQLCRILGTDMDRAGKEVEVPGG